MDRYHLALTTTKDPKTLAINVRKALVCGYFTQVAHRIGEKSSYLTVKNNEVGMFLWVETSVVLTRWCDEDCGSSPLLRSGRKATMGRVQRIRVNRASIHPDCHCGGTHVVRVLESKGSVVLIVPVL